MGSDPIPLPHKNWNEVDPDALRKTIARNQSSNNELVQTSTNSHINTEAITTNPTDASTKCRCLRYFKILLGFLLSTPIIVILRAVMRSIAAYHKQHSPPNLPHIPEWQLGFSGGRSMN